MKVIKFLFLFLIYGTAWFLIFSIPLSPHSNIFIALQKTLKILPGQDESKKLHKEINPAAVIDALTKAFKSD